MPSGRPFTRTSDDRLAERHDRLQQLLLAAGQVERGARGALAAHVGGLAEDRDDDVGAARRGDRLLERGLGDSSGVCGGFFEARE